MAVVAVHAAEAAGIYQHALRGGEWKLGLNRSFLGIARRQNHQPNLEFVFLGEFVIPIVVSGHAHDGAGAVIHQDVVGHPDRHLFAVIRIDGIAAGVDAVLLDLADVTHFPGLALLRDELVDCRRAAGRYFW